ATLSAASSAASRRMAPPGDVTRLHVLESDGRPNAHMGILLAPRSVAERPTRTALDAQGWVDLPVSHERRALAIERERAFPFRTEIELDGSERTLALPAPVGAILSGRVTVAGAAPPRP